MASTRQRAAIARVALAVWALLAAGCAQAPSRPADAAPGEPVVFPEAYRHSIAALGYPGARRAFQVGHGSAVSNGDVALTWRWLAAVGDTTTTPVYFERDGVPVAHWTATDGAHEVAFEAAATPNEALGDSSLILSVRMTVTRRAPAHGRFAMEAAVATTVPGPHALPWDAPEAGAPRLTARGRVVRVDGRNGAGCSGGAPFSKRAAATSRVTMSLEAELSLGQSRVWDFWMPLYPAAMAESDLAAAAHHATVVSDTRTRWRGWLGRAAHLDTPDDRIDMAWRAALVTLVQDHERDQGRWVPIGNPFQYRDVWIRDGARVVRALAVVGLTEVARDDARSLARFQFPSGALLSQRGQLDGTGQALWAFDQASAMPPSEEAARVFLPFARGGVDWIVRTRAYSHEIELDWAGLMPYADPRDNELVRAELVGNDAWSIAGLRAARSLAWRARDTVLARRAEAAFDGYQAAFRAALARTGHRDVPASWRGPGRDWGNLSVCYPTGVMTADDPRLFRLDARKSGERSRTGLISSGHPDSLHTYLGADLAQWALLAGRPAEARRWLAGVLSHSSSTLGQSEVFHRDGRFGENLPPHGTAAATLVDLLRNMVVCDFRDSLDLALGGDLDWWEGTRLVRAPTRFGIVDVALRRTDGDVLEASFSAVPVVVRVRIPDGVRVVEVLTPGARVAGDYVEGDGGLGAIVFRVAVGGPSFAGAIRP